MTERTTDKEPKRVPARAYRRRSQPGAIDLVAPKVWTFFGDEAKSRSLSTEHPLTGKPDAGDSACPVWREGADIRSPYPYHQTGGYFFGRDSMIFATRPFASCSLKLPLTSALPPGISI